jgi:Cys-tRNA(Pro)/Cys-tRNA(Cys) deacylase
MTDAPGPARVRADAAARGLAIEVLERAAAGSLEEAARIMGVSPGDIVKSMVVKRRDGTFLFAEVPGDRQISWPKLRALAVANKLALPDAGTALAATGYERGTITPLGSTTPWPVYADERIRGRVIHLGGGAHGLSVRVDGDAFLAAFDAIVGDITDPAP